MTRSSFQMQPVWVNGKLVEPKGYISPEIQERIDRCVAESDAARKIIEERAAQRAQPQPDSTAQRPSTAPRWPEDMR